MERRPIERVRGTQDLWPAEARQLDAIRHRLENTFAAFGYARIEVPVIEQAALHMRKSGLEIIAKLYAFEDQGGRRLCLRPELTASVARALVANRPPRLPLKLFSSGPVFRYERPSRGRYRQFTQAGVEVIGAEGAAADAEVIFLAMEALAALRLARYRVTIGHIGVLSQLLAELGLNARLRAFLLDSVEEARRRGVDAIRAHLQEVDPDLFGHAAPSVGGDGGHAPGGADGDGDAVSGDAAGILAAELLAEMGSQQLGRRRREDVLTRMLEKRRPDAGPGAIERVLRFVERLGRLTGPADGVLRDGRSLLEEYRLSDEPLRQLEATLTLLGQYGADLDRVQLDLGLSRGLQYYTGMVFEIDHDGLGAESQLCGGGRYDELIRALGARQSTPALGFAFGVERVRLALEAESELTHLGPHRAEVFIAPTGAEQRGYAQQVAQTLRRAGLCVDVEVAARPLRASLAYADHAGFAHVAVVGPDDAAAGTVRLRDMARGEERTVLTDQVAAVISRPPVEVPGG